MRNASCRTVFWEDMDSVHLCLKVLQIYTTVLYFLESYCEAKPMKQIGMKPDFAALCVMQLCIRGIILLTAKKS